MKMYRRNPSERRRKQIWACVCVSVRVVSCEGLSEAHLYNTISVSHRDDD